MIGIAGIAILKAAGWDFRLPIKTFDFFKMVNFRFVIACEFLFEGWFRFLGFGVAGCVFLSELKALEVGFNLHCAGWSLLRGENNIVQGL